MNTHEYELLKAIVKILVRFPDGEERILDILALAMAARRPELRIVRD